MRQSKFRHASEIYQIVLTDYWTSPQLAYAITFSAFFARAFRPLVTSGDFSFFAGDFRCGQGFVGLMRAVGITRRPTLDRPNRRADLEDEATRFAAAGLPL